MTPTLAVLAADPLDDLRALLERVREQREGVLGVEPGLISGGEADWTPAAELAREPYDTLDTWIDATARRWGAPRHVGAALLWKAYAYWHAMPMALGWALNRRVPIMPFDRTVARESPAGVTVAATSITVAVLPDDPYAGRPGTVTVPDLGAAVREALLAGQGPLIDALTRLTRVGTRPLWGSTAEALVQPLYGFADVLPGDPAVDAAALLDSIGGPVRDLVTFTPGGYRRRTCCLWLTLPDAQACSTCCALRG
ncbi:(2Fe-2S)-binding protein [Thermostaphylospora chromogena]|uniref:Ferric iron reductase protein FhuF, involved in iron transport n=1 Tax=Thermostaphylospora chromogena TaxID=35622 RepID=A0A1H1A8U0_9ACTN|nr:(2Fe-2S)-binding protein [Thermostaphylospora chromogena]SDQ36145.1 Ferric iron reductase protein FhuF, involved in iron transport [Thermostaphylospora chromogena]